MTIRTISRKRQINDIGPALSTRLSTMNWLAGLIADNEKSLWINKYYPTGSYDNPKTVECHVHYDKILKTSFYIPSTAFLVYQQFATVDRRPDFICFLVQRGVITNMNSQDANRTIDRISKHLDYNESLPPSSPVNARAIEEIRSRLLRDLPEVAEGVSMDATNTVLVCRNNIHAVGSNLKEEKIMAEDSVILEDAVVFNDSSL